MPGKLDEISEAIGSLRASVSNLHDQINGVTVRMDAREVVQDRRHRENQKSIEDSARENREAIEASKKAVQDIMDIVRPLSDAVKTMTPIVNAYQISRWKKAGALGLAVTLLSALGWLLEAVIIKAVSWTIAHLH